MPFSDFVIELGLELELETEQESIGERVRERFVDVRWMFDGSCSWE